MRINGQIEPIRIRDKSDIYIYRFVHEYGDHLPVRSVWYLLGDDPSTEIFAMQVSNCTLDVFSLVQFIKYHQQKSRWNPATIDGLMVFLYIYI